LPPTGLLRPQFATSATGRTNGTPSAKSALIPRAGLHISPRSVSTNWAYTDVFSETYIFSANQNHPEYASLFHISRQNLFEDSAQISHSFHPLTAQAAHLRNRVPNPPERFFPLLGKKSSVTAGCSPYRLASFDARTACPEND
jgi:hypothetical protein